MNRKKRKGKTRTSAKSKKEKNRSVEPINHGPTPKEKIAEPEVNLIGVDSSGKPIGALLSGNDFVEYLRKSIDQSVYNHATSQNNEFKKTYLDFVEMDIFLKSFHQKNPEYVPLMVMEYLRQNLKPFHKNANEARLLAAQVLVAWRDTKGLVTTHDDLQKIITEVYYKSF